MKNKSIKILSILAIFLLVFTFLFASVNVVKAKASETTYYKRFTPADLLIEINQGNYNMYNSGSSFVFWGTSSTNMNIEVSITLTSLFDGYDFRNNNFIMTYRSGNQGNTISLLNFKTQYGNNDTTSWQTDFVFAPILPTPFFDVLSGNSYFMPYNAFAVKFVFTFIVDANVYNEFSFNDFTLDLYNDYSTAFNDGELSGYNRAKDEYYQSRYDSGYSDGLRDGVDRNQYNFYTLLSAVIETPINAGLSMLNFDFLGFNMRDFFLAIFTIALIITVLRFILQR